MVKTGHIVRSIACALAFALMLKLFLFDFMVAEGPSMQPAIKPGRILVICKASYGLRLPAGNYLLRWAHPRKGDVVVFYTPLGEIAVKRCAESMEDYFYAVGDNGLHSYDSRSYGPVSVDSIIGRVLGVK